MKVIKWTVAVFTILILAAVLFLRSEGMFATKPIYTKDGVAIAGYDPVSYFERDAPVQGAADIQLQWNGVTWYFASEAHKDKFKANPERYVPQFGGYCAFAVSQGYTAKTDPNAFEIVGGKLFLNYDQAVLEEWSANKDELIPSGEANWPGVLIGQ